MLAIVAAGWSVAASSNAGPTIVDVQNRLESNAGRLRSCSVVLHRQVKSVGAHGRVLQQFSDDEQVAVSRSSFRVRRGASGGELFDCASHKRTRKIQDGTREWPFSGTLEQAMPPVLAYAISPAAVLESAGTLSVDVAAGGVTVIAKPRGASGGNARWEAVVDLERGVIMSVKTYGSKGELVEEATMQGWEKHDGCWLPRSISLRKFASRNNLQIRYILKELQVNLLSTESLAP